MRKAVAIGVRLVVVSCGVALAGCYAQHADVAAINAQYLKQEQAPVVVPGETARAAPVRSVYGLDRSNWQPTTVLTALTPTEHGQTYRSTPLYQKSLARQRGDYPTTESVTDLMDDESRWLAAAEGMAQPGWVVFDGVLLVPHLLMNQRTRDQYTGLKTGLEPKQVASVPTFGLGISTKRVVVPSADLLNTTPAKP